jgi:hypothetical protein
LLEMTLERVRRMELAAGRGTAAGHGRGHPSAAPLAPPGATDQRPERSATSHPLAPDPRGGRA